MKHLCDAQMIAQLCEKQDVEDKKQIGVFGIKKNEEVVRGDSIIEESVESPRPVLKVDRDCLSCSGNMA